MSDIGNPELDIEVLTVTHRSKELPDILHFVLKLLCSVLAASFFFSEITLSLLFCAVTSPTVG